MEGITPEVLLVLDPASSTGYCLCKITANTASIYEYGFIDVDLKSEYQGDHCIDLMVKLDALIDLHRVTHIAIEDYFFSKRFAKGSNVNAAFRTAIHILARAKGIPYTILNITSWKIYVAGRSTPTKEQKKRWVQIRQRSYISNKHCGKGIILNFQTIPSHPRPTNRYNSDLILWMHAVKRYFFAA